MEDLQFDKQIEKKSLMSSGGKVRRYRRASLSDSEIMTILIMFQFGSFRNTYGHIAALAGWPSHSRMVGRTLRYTFGAEALPCHRVVNKEGRTAPGWSRQRSLLEEEGVTFKSNGHVDMQRHLWVPEKSEE